LGIENLSRGVGMPEAEAFWRHVARHPDMSNVVVAILWNPFQTLENVVYWHVAGRQKATTNPDDRLIVIQAWCHRFKNVTPLWKAVHMAKLSGFSTLTIWNRLHDGGIWARQNPNLILMTHNYIQTHLQYARDHLKWILNAWTSVLFTYTDE